MKVHILQSHLDKFPQNLDSFNDEQEERFLQDIKGNGGKIPGKVEYQHDIITGY
jgi:hypothetical protein